MTPCCFVDVYGHYRGAGFLHLGRSCAPLMESISLTEALVSDTLHHMSEGGIAIDIAVRINLGDELSRI